ncbi:Ig-like V-type domain-containing protein FAM187A [Mizuhopecten yessoensis]|uniref:Ig-like V-type domain-containing protein FAM187A n=1 Tax=Mizuhopecten yessoensis TaxID=6573 RepID=UPI000B457D53|nr:Ig-like V-type domain-containing protein FAM187A [Mizuhopecten yessoensis]
MEATCSALVKRHATSVLCTFTAPILITILLFIYSNKGNFFENDHYDGFVQAEDDELIQKMLQHHMAKRSRSERATKTKGKTNDIDFSIYQEMGWELSPQDALQVFDAYYDCLLKRESSDTGKLDITAVLSLEGQNIELKCPMCLRPDQDAGVFDVQWQQIRARDSAMRYVEESSKFKFTDKMSLVISGVDIIDAGQFFCVRMRDREIEQIYQLDVLFRERRKVINGSERHNILPVETMAENNLKLSTLWSDWSACNRCGKMGHRRMVGLCMVEKVNASDPVEPVDLPIIELYPRGLPCRSTVLPSQIARLRSIRLRQSETIVENCYRSCPTAAPPITVTDKNGNVLQVIQPGYYSMKDKPPLPRLVKRSVIYEETGKNIILKCPTKPNEDSLVRWQNGTVVINPLSIRRQTRGRVRMDSANRLHIRALRLYDSAPYNCWLKQRHVATLKVVVVQAMNHNLKDYITYAGLCLTILSVTLVCLCVFSGRNKKTIK